MGFLLFNIVLFLRFFDLYPGFGDKFRIQINLSGEASSALRRMKKTLIFAP